MERVISAVNAQERLTSGEYTPPVLPVAQLRETWRVCKIMFCTFFVATISIYGCTYVPKYRIHRAVEQIYRNYVRGKVLDLSPKLNNPTDVALYECSRATRVEYLISEHISDDVKYTRAQEDENDDKVKEERQYAMTLDYLIWHDPYWYVSPVTFATVEVASLTNLNSAKYDCVLVRDLLMTLKCSEARRMFDSAAEYLTTDGQFIVMDVGLPHWRRLAQLFRWYNKVTDSSMCWTHNYHEWITESLLYEIVAERRLMWGLYYTLVLRRKNRSLV